MPQSAQYRRREAYWAFGVASRSVRDEIIRRRKLNGELSAKAAEESRLRVKIRRRISRKYIYRNIMAPRRASAVAQRRKRLKNMAKI